MSSFLAINFVGITGCKYHKTGPLNWPSQSSSEFQNSPYPSKDTFCRICAKKLQTEQKPSPFGYAMLSVRARSAPQIAHEGVAISCTPRFPQHIASAKSCYTIATTEH